MSRNTQLHAEKLGDHPLGYARRIQRLWLLDGTLFPAESVRYRSQHPCIDRCSHSEAYPVQSFRSCFGILRYAEKYSPEALERCCKDAVLAGKCNYSYICNTISTYYKEPAQSTIPQRKTKEEAAAAVSGTYKDDDSKYSLKNLQENPILS